MSVALTLRDIEIWRCSRNSTAVGTCEVIKMVYNSLQLFTYHHYKGGDHEGENNRSLCFLLSIFLLSSDSGNRNIAYRIQLTCICGVGVDKVEGHATIHQQTELPSIQKKRSSSGRSPEKKKNIRQKRSSMESYTDLCDALTAAAFAFFSATRLAIRALIPYFSDCRSKDKHNALVFSLLLFLVL